MARLGPADFCGPAGHHQRNSENRENPELLSPRAAIWSPRSAPPAPQPADRRNGAVRVQSASAVVSPWAGGRGDRPPKEANGQDKCTAPHVYAAFTLHEASPPRIRSDVAPRKWWAANNSSMNFVSFSRTSSSGLTPHPAKEVSTTVGAATCAPALAIGESHIHPIPTP
eukprot:gene24472-biopygen20897